MLCAAFPDIDITQLKNVMITDPKPNLFTQPFYKLINRRGCIDHGGEIIRKYSPHANVSRIAQHDKAVLLKHLYTFGKPAFKAKTPSSGMLAIEHFLKQQAQVYIIGFGFKGWKRHPWDLEKQYVASLIAKQKVQLLKSPS
ncbi:hypothetical protein P4S68_13415 [Pseudoalteromonas sp. Hal099]